MFVAKFQGGLWITTIDLFGCYMIECGNSQQETIRVLVLRIPIEIIRLERAIKNSEIYDVIKRYQNTVSTLKEIFHEYSLGANAL